MSLWQRQEVQKVPRPVKTTEIAFNSPHPHQRSVAKKRPLIVLPRLPLPYIRGHSARGTPFFCAAFCPLSQADGPTFYPGF